jgi:hypothetical protein
LSLSRDGRRETNEGYGGECVVLLEAIQRDFVDAIRGRTSSFIFTGLKAGASEVSQKGRQPASRDV